MPSMDWAGSRGAQFSLSVESDPPGADARMGSAAACKTPCTLMVAGAGDFSVDVSLAGYLPQSVPVRLLPPDDPRSEYSTARLDPNPVFVVLERAPPPPPPPKKRPVKKRPTAAKPAPQPASAASTPAPAPAPTAQPAPSGNAPWPMPR